MWWCIVTLTTTGYGDLYPITVAGRIIAGVTMFMGLILFGMLMSIVGKTIMVMLFGESLDNESAEKPTTPKEKVAAAITLFSNAGVISAKSARMLSDLSKDELAGRLNRDKVSG